MAYFTTDFALEAEAMTAQDTRRTPAPALTAGALSNDDRCRFVADGGFT